MSGIELPYLHHPAGPSQEGGFFSRTVNPISTRGSILCPPQYYEPPPPDFQTLRRPWSLFYGFSSFQTLTWFMTKNIWTRSKNKSILRTFKKQWLYLNLIRRNLHSGINICVKKSWIHPRFLVRKKSARTKFALVKSLVTKMHEANIQGLFWNWA